MNFDDIICLTVELLENFQEVREYYQRKFHYVLIDEYQDTNRLQYRLAALLAGGHENICVVGDDDQSIYRFRGATIENILNFEQCISRGPDHPSGAKLPLDPVDLEAASGVIANNSGRRGKPLDGQRGGGTHFGL